MNPQFQKILAASPEDRRDLFLETANRLPSTLQNVEKDFWVCWVLDLLFNGAEAGEPRLLFKGGTSLSKAYGLISRFSEDIDITVFRGDIGQPASIEELEGLTSNNQLKRRLEAIKGASREHIQGPLKDRLNRQILAQFAQAGINVQAAPVVVDPDDDQSLLVRYPPVSGADPYVKSEVKIEAGARSALDPHQPTLLRPYIAEGLPDDLTVGGILTIDAQRTFWDKVLILHGLRAWYEKHQALRHDGNRESRHYYDIFRLMRSGVGQRAAKDKALALDCVRHAKMFFNRPDLDLAHAKPGSFAITPPVGMEAMLRRDYQAMARMIFGDIPDLADVLAEIAQLERLINQP